MRLDNKIEAIELIERRADLLAEVLGDDHPDTTWLRGRLLGWSAENLHLGT